MKSQSAQVLETARELRAAQKAVEAKQAELRKQLKELFGCGPKMTREEQLRFLVEFFAFPDLN